MTQSIRHPLDIADDLLRRRRGVPVLDHPEEDGLNLTCDGRLVKL